MDFQLRFKGKITLMTKDGIQGQTSTFTAQNKKDIPRIDNEKFEQSNSSKKLLQIKSSINAQNAQKIYLDQIGDQYKSDQNSNNYSINENNHQNVNSFNKHAQQIISNTHYMNQGTKIQELKRGNTADYNNEMNKNYNQKSTNRNQRSLDYLPYTYKDYQNLQQSLIIKKSGGLGANINTEEWKDKKQKAQKAQEFSQQIQLNNKQKQLFSQQSYTERKEPESMKHTEFIQYLEKIKNQKQY